MRPIFSEDEYAANDELKRRLSKNYKDDLTEEKESVEQDLLENE